MHLKMFVLSGAALTLWLAPLTTLDKRIGWHKSMQGLSLCAAIACAVSAGNIARKLAEENEIEELKTRAIKADQEDEIATEVYVSQKQRQNAAEQILNPIEHLERALALPCGDDDDLEPIAKNQLAEPKSERPDDELRERILQLKDKGYGKAKIILQIWEATKGGSAKYRAAEAEYMRLTGE